MNMSTLKLIVTANKIVNIRVTCMCRNKINKTKLFYHIVKDIWKDSYLTIPALSVAPSNYKQRVGNFRCSSQSISPVSQTHRSVKCDWAVQSSKTNFEFCEHGSCYCLFLGSGVAEDGYSSLKWIHTSQKVDNILDSNGESLLESNVRVY